MIDVQAALDKFREPGQTVNMKKSKLLRTSLKFLAHVVSAMGDTDTSASCLGAGLVQKTDHGDEELIFF